MSSHQLFLESPEHLCPHQDPGIPDPAEPLPIRRQLLALLLLLPRSPSKFSSSSCSPCQQLGLIHHLLPPCSGCAGEKLPCPLPESPHAAPQGLHPSILTPIPDWEGRGSRRWGQQEEAAGSLSTNSCLTHGMRRAGHCCCGKAAFPLGRREQWQLEFLMDRDVRLQLPKIKRRLPVPRNNVREKMLFAYVQKAIIPSLLGMLRVSRGNAAL